MLTAITRLIRNFILLMTILLWCCNVDSSDSIFHAPPNPAIMA
jgi:hypothetical protein